MSATTVVRERPILFSAAMVRAILDGRKTQTRRPVKAAWQELPLHNADYASDAVARCPFGGPGDRLWVRETYLRMLRDEWAVMYADDDDYDICYPSKKDTIDLGWRVRSAIHMPRRDSRLTLEITKVRVEPLQSICAQDCIDEGLTTTLREHDAVADLREQYRALWDSLNASRGYGWDVNPWVWVLTFRAVPSTEHDAGGGR